MVSLIQKEDEKQFSESEMDDTKEKENKTFPAEEKLDNFAIRYLRGGKLYLLVIIGLCLLIGIGGFYLYTKGISSPPNKKVINVKAVTHRIENLATSSDQTIFSGSFIIPCEEEMGNKYTYITLSISFNMPNIKLKPEIIEKNDFLRGIVYDLLKKEINKGKEIPSLNILQKVIIKAVNEAVSGGQLDKVYITDFLAV